jgi:hypothetical protein
LLRLAFGVVSMLFGAGIILLALSGGFVDGHLFVSADGPHLYGTNAMIGALFFVVAGSALIVFGMRQVRRR